MISRESFIEATVGTYKRMQRNTMYKLLAPALGIFTVAVVAMVAKRSTSSSGTAVRKRQLTEELMANGPVPREVNDRGRHREDVQTQS